MKTNSASPETENKMSQMRRNIGSFGKKFLHPVNAHYHGEGAPPGIRLANHITGFMGSWTFLIIQTVVVTAWIVFNIVAWIHGFDLYPFILLNLAFSTQAAYAAPLILMAGNVTAEKDRELWDSDYATNQKASEKVESMERRIKQLVEQNQQLLNMMVEQRATK